MSPAESIAMAEAPQQEGIKETIESIVVALILAFVFRAFIVEAFVIPTGSMAPTLYGAHGTIICEDCGIEFAYGLKDLEDNRRSVQVLATSKAVCPNCNHVNSGLTISDERGNAEKGDRILVLKWPLAIGGAGLDSARWDVTVFKDPADGDTNFIKRLVGLPNEVLMIVDGDVYTVPTKALSSETLNDLEELRHEKYEFRTGIRSGRLRPLPPAAMNELRKKMTIARKTPAAQDALWSVVYDNDHVPRTRGPDQPRWVAGRGPDSGWRVDGRVLRFDEAGAEDDGVVLAGKEIAASCAYNIHHAWAAPVSDLRTRFVFSPKNERADVCVRLEKLGRVFWAGVRADGAVTLRESRDPPTGTTPPMASATIAPIRPGESVEVSFENVDYQLALRVRDREVLASSSDPQSPAYYAPDLTALSRRRPERVEPPRILGAGGAFELSHVIVERDEYYFLDPSVRAFALRWTPASGWGSEASPILLRDDEFFMLGDNTSASKDSRLWDEVAPELAARGEAFQLGTVPRDQLIGRAFFVYWPSGHALPLLPQAGAWRWRVIPDVGRMRWIR